MGSVILIKLSMIQYLFGIKNIRQTIKEIKVNIVYRLFLGLSLKYPVQHLGKTLLDGSKDQNSLKKIVKF